MYPDPRRVLEEAAQQRAAVEILPRGGGLVQGRVVRIERGGVVVTAPARRFLGGEDVRVWLATARQSWTFEASVIRAGVPVPDRSQDGILLGFIDRFAEGGLGGRSGGRTIELVPPSGQPISLISEPARVVHLAVDGITFTLPSSSKLIWVEQGTVAIRLGIMNESPVVVAGRIRTLAPEEGYLLYDLVFEKVEDPAAHRALIEGLNKTLE